MLEELSRTWSVVLIRPAGGARASVHGVSLAAEIELGRTGQWMYLPSQYDVGPVVRSVAEATHSHRPSVALLWGGMEYLKREVAQMPPAVSDRVDCMTLSTWRQLWNTKGAAARWRRTNDFLYAAQYELSVRSLSAATVVVGEEDARVLRRVIRVRDVHVIPNGVDLPTSLSEEKSPTPTVTFTGVLSYQPNIDAVLHFANDIWPAVKARVPAAVFQVVGRSPGPEIYALSSRPGVEVHADVPSVQMFLAKAWLAVAPMRSGAGLKNKILESWAVGTPAVMTPIATNGLTDAPKDLLLAAEGNKLGDMVGDLLLDTKRRNALGLSARTTARQAFSWQTHALALSRLLSDFSR
jgi:glycosyltransferase involved in cell wall biosynthesis